MRIPTKKTHRIIQIEVTTVCDLDCNHCTRALAQTPKLHMPIDLFEKAIIACKDWIIRENGTLALFGGNPCLWKHFNEGCKILRQHLPTKNMGLWTNNIFEKGAVIREYFARDSMFNLIAHGKPEAYDKMVKEIPWGRVHSRDKGTFHASIFVAPKDFISEDEIWERQAKCTYDIEWSAIVMLEAPDYKTIGGYSCEIAGTHARVNGKALGIPIEAGWLDRGLEDFQHQYKFACPNCSGLLNLDGVLDLDHETGEQFSKSNEHLVALTVSKTRKASMVESIPSNDHRKPIQYIIK